MVTFTQAQLLAWISPLLWPFLRTLALFTAAPMLSQRAVPVRLRIALSALIAIAAQPALTGVPVPSLSDPSALLVSAQQVLVGLAMGFAVRVAFAAVEFGGELMGLQMGLNYASFFDPSSGGSSNGVARFLGTLAMLVFIAADGHLFMIGAVVRSFEVFPAGADMHTVLAAFSPQRLGAELFQVGLWLALPVVGIVLAVNLALGVVSRVVPQMNIFAVGFPITLATGLIGLVLTLPFMEIPLATLVERALPMFSPLR